MEIQVDCMTISPSNPVKYLGVFLDQNSTYQSEVKNLLMKMACVIKTKYPVRYLFPGKTSFLLLNAWGSVIYIIHWYYRME